MSHQIGDRWKIQNEVFRFFRTDPTAPVFRLNGIMPLGTVNPLSLADLGTEWDSSIQFMPKTVTLWTGVSTLFPGGSLFSQFGDSKPVFAFLQMEVKI